MKIVDIADELFRELSNPTDLSIPAIAYWLRTNIGSLNNAIHSYFSVDPQTLEFSETTDNNIPGSTPTSVPFGEEEKSILKSMYMLHYYDVKIRGFLGASGYNVALEVTSDGATVRLASKTEIAKTYLQAKRLESENLNKLIASYQTTKALPSQVAGDDTQPGFYTAASVYNRGIN